MFHPFLKWTFGLVENFFVNAFLLISCAQVKKFLNSDLAVACNLGLKLQFCDVTLGAPLDNTESVTGICTSKHTQNVLFAKNLKDTFLMNIFCIIVYTNLAKFLPNVSKRKDPFLFIVNPFFYPIC